MSYYKSEQFKRLQIEWYKKLKTQGFNDIETAYNPDMLRVYDCTHFQSKYTPDLFMMKETYYAKARHFLHVYRFPSELEQIVWMMHSEGLSLRTIAKEIGSTVCKVHKMIRALCKEMRAYAD